MLRQAEHGREMIIKVNNVPSRFNDIKVEMPHGSKMRSRYKMPVVK